MTRGLSIAILLTTVGLAIGCAEEIRSEASDRVGEDGESRKVASLAVTVPETEIGLTFDTHLYSERDADVYNRLMVEETAGGGIPVTAIHVELGDRVREGQVLATLEDADARLYVEAAEPKAEVAAANLRRIEELRESGAVSEAEHEAAEFESRTAAAALEQARLNLSRTRIRAPFSGVVSRRYVRVGDVVDDETPLFRVTALAPLRARLLVPEAEIDLFRKGALLRVTAADGARGTAEVIIVSPTIDAGSGTREVIVQLTEVGDFRPGASVTAELMEEPS